MKRGILICLALFVTVTTGSDSEEADEVPRMWIKKGDPIPAGEECFCETKDEKKEPVKGGDLCCKKSGKGSLLTLWGTEEEPEAQWCAILPQEDKARQTYKTCCDKLNGNGICDKYGTFVKEEKKKEHKHRAEAIRRWGRERAQRRKARKERKRKHKKHHHD